MRGLTEPAASSSEGGGAFSFLTPKSLFIFLRSGAYSRDARSRTLLAASAGTRDASFARLYEPIRPPETLLGRSEPTGFVPAPWFVTSARQLFQYHSL